MRILIILALAAAAVTATGCGPVKKKAPPPGADAKLTYKGSYANSCRNIVALENGFLSAECAGDQGYVPTKIQADLCQGDIGNNNGVLVCNGATAVAPSAPNTPAPRPAPAPAEPSPAEAAAKADAAKADAAASDKPKAADASAK